ncbi:glycosyltransferase, partial [Rosenbergiella epipactidis]|uniref:glycosyltransferase n=1 Tax=Rosenbergiella epipactidis TaxID=1544694 RepID=UPI001F4FDE87
YIFLAQGEKLLFEKDFDIQVKNYVLTKNGCDVKDKVFIGNLHKDIDIIISGRIEPRKNSINLLRVLGGADYKVKFVGSLNKNNKSYTDEFLSLVKGYDNIDYLGSVTHDDMQSLFKRSKIHISASWFEVSSLVDLEAYFLGCHVISSINGNTNEFIKKNIDFINPEDLSGLNDLLKDILINYT